MTTLRQSLERSIARLEDDPRPVAQSLLKDYKNQLAGLNVADEESAQSQESKDRYCLTSLLRRIESQKLLQESLKD